MKIAVEGCAHGELDKIYESIEELEKENRIKIDLLIICGDFQSVRNPTDLECMAVPPKYRQMNTFYKYYSGEKMAPVLTVFIGGNHEASNYLSELSYGGWVCPNIYYMGHAGVINIGGIRIAGLSGIFKGRDYLKGHFECPPYDESSKKSVYHVRNLDVFRLKQIQNPIDICISHDWPRGIYHHGNKQALLKWKSFFREEMESNKLGSQAAEELLEKLKPTYWFAAHLHCKFVAVVHHKDTSRPQTKFLALDKCLPRRNFLQVLDFASENKSVQIEYDPEWLCILRSTDHLLNTTRRNSYMPGVGSNERWNFQPTEEEMLEMKQLFQNNFRVPNNFTVTAPTYNPSQPGSGNPPLKIYINPQTQALCRILDITDPLVAVSKNSKDSINISDFSCTDTDLSYTSLSSFNIDSTRGSDGDSSSGSISPRNELDSTGASDVGASQEESSEVCGFYIDKFGTHEKDSDLFFIDTVGSNASKPDDTISSKDNIQEHFTDFYIDRTSSQEDSSRFNDQHTNMFESQSHTTNLKKEIPSLKGPSNSAAVKRKSPIPSPKHTTFLQTPLCSTPVTENRSLESFPELKQNANSNNVVENEEQIPLTKKFKRRNWSLYQSECDIST